VTLGALMEADNRFVNEGGRMSARTIISEAYYEALADARVMRRLPRDPRYVNAEDAEQQSQAERDIEREVCEELHEQYVVR
jgi:hypothetical protein